MGTAVVSGRIDEGLKQRAGAFIEAAGMTVTDVIKNVWEAIALTGQVPMPVTEETARDSRRQLFEEFASFTQSLPACSSVTACMDDRAMRSLIAERYE